MDKGLCLWVYEYCTSLLPIVLGFTPTFIGIVITIAVLYNALFNVFVSKYTDSLGRNKTLILFSILMGMSALLLLIRNVVTILIASIMGLLSVTGTEAGPFLSIEQSVLTKLVNDNKRTASFSIYNFLGYSASSPRALFSYIPFKFLSHNDAFITSITFYGLVRIILTSIYLSLGDRLELSNVKVKRQKLTLETKKRVLRLTLLFS